MLGAILGDIIGSPYEKKHAISINAHDFPLFCENSRFTDDTVMTIAIGDAILAGHEKSSDETIRENVIKKTFSESDFSICDIENYTPHILEKMYL